MKTNYIIEMIDEFKDFDPSPEELNEKYKLAVGSILEVQGLIRFEDFKASRILTAIAFLSGMFAAMYATMQRALGPIAFDIQQWNWALWLYNLLFVFYLLLIVSGVILTVFAVRAKYNLPPESISMETSLVKDPKTGEIVGPHSYIFFEKIIGTPPRNWARSWIDTKPHELKKRFFKNLVVETYIISMAIRRKYLFLKPGVQLICTGAAMFVIWLFAAICVILTTG